MTRPSPTAAATGALASAAVWLGRDRLPGGARWERTNHRGEPITMREGPAWAAGALAALALGPGLTGRQRSGLLLAAGTAAGLGCLDDLAETGRSKGLKGHLGALRRGRLTTGGAKILGISTAGLVAGRLLLDRHDDHRDDHPLSHLADVVVAGGVIAGTANLINLLDLRPGRALKVVTAGAVALTAAGPGNPALPVVQAALLGPSAVLLKVDLDERGMLGDCGANAAGAVLGCALVLIGGDTDRGRLTRLITLAGLTGLTLASEKVSFTKVIESTPGLRELDRWGRRPPGAP